MGGLLFIYGHLLYEIIQSNVLRAHDEFSFYDFVKVALRAAATGLIAVGIILVGGAKCLS